MFYRADTFVYSFFPHISHSIPPPQISRSFCYIHLASFKPCGIAWKKISMKDEKKNGWGMNKMRCSSGFFSICSLKLNFNMKKKKNPQVFHCCPNSITVITCWLFAFLTTKMWINHEGVGFEMKLNFIEKNQKRAFYFTSLMISREIWKNPSEKFCILHSQIDEISTLKTRFAYFLSSFFFLWKKKELLILAKSLLELSACVCVCFACLCGWT